MVVGKAASLLVRIFALDICVFVLWILVVFGIDKAMLNSSFPVRVFFFKRFDLLSAFMSLDSATIFTRSKIYILYSKTFSQYSFLTFHTLQNLKEIFSFFLYFIFFYSRDHHGQMAT